MGRFPYYRRLSRQQKAIYRQSDEITDVPLPDRAALRPDAEALRDALEDGDRVAVERAAARLVMRVLAQLQVSPLSVRVLAVRPRSASSELHGLYSHEEGRRPLIQVWMKTAANRRVVAFRTFLRTLMHEVCHHLDYAFFGLGDSFHTEGFFRRESSLVRQIAGASQRRRPRQAAGAPATKENGKGAGRGAGRRPNRPKGKGPSDSAPAPERAAPKRPAPERAAPKRPAPERAAPKRPERPVTPELPAIAERPAPPERPGPPERPAAAPEAPSEPLPKPSPPAAVTRAGRSGRRARRPRGVQMELPLGEGDG